MKYILLLFSLIFIAGCTNVPQDIQVAEFVPEQENVLEETQNAENSNSVQLNSENTFFEFEGYAPGKSHVGTITKWDGNVEYNDNQITKINAVFDMNSVDTGIGGLDNHLKSEDFFFVEEHPDAIFETITIDTQQTRAYMNFRGVQREIVISTNNLTKDFYSTEFLLNMSNYGINHPATDDLVRMKIEINLS